MERRCLCPGPGEWEAEGLDLTTHGQSVPQGAGGQTRQLLQSGCRGSSLGAPPGTSPEGPTTSGVHTGRGPCWAGWRGAVRLARAEQGGAQSSESPGGQLGAQCPDGQMWFQSHLSTSQAPKGPREAPGEQVPASARRL